MTLRSMSRTIILIAAGNIGFLCAPAPIFAQERECSVPERFYISEPQLTKTPKAIAHGQEVVIVALGGASTLSIAAGKPELAWPAPLRRSARREIPFGAHQGRQSRGGAPDGEAGGGAPGSRGHSHQAQPRHLGDRYHGSGSRNGH